MKPVLGPAPTEEQLRALYARELPHRPHWPRAFEAAQAHPLVSRTLALLHRTAHTPTPDRRATRAPTAAERAALRPAALPPAPHVPTWKPRQLAPGEVDRRRAASGDDPDKDSA